MASVVVVLVVLVVEHTDEMGGGGEEEEGSNCFGFAICSTKTRHELLRARTDALSARVVAQDRAAGRRAGVGELALIDGAAESSLSGRVDETVVALHRRRIDRKKKASLL